MIHVSCNPADMFLQAWSYKAKNSTFRAVTNAGFNISNFPKLSKTRLIKEPEAAAFYALRYLHETEVGYLAVSKSPQHANPSNDDLA